MKNPLGNSMLAMGLVLLLIGACAQPASAAPEQVPSGSDLKEMLSEGVGYPPYRVAVSVQSAHSPDRTGTKDLFVNCLRENLKALGDLNFVDAPGTEKPPATLLLRVRFTQTLKPDEYECFDTTMVVVVSKILKEDARYEAILDTYALAGVAERDLESMCNKIAIRFDLKILSILRQLHQPRKQP